MCHSSCCHRLLESAAGAIFENGNSYCSDGSFISRHKFRIKIQDSYKVLFFKNAVSDAAAAAATGFPVTAVNGGGGEAAGPAAASTCSCPPERSHERGGEDNTAAGSADAAEGEITYSEPFLYILSSII